MPQGHSQYVRYFMVHHAGGQIHDYGGLTMKGRFVMYRLKPRFKKRNEVVLASPLLEIPSPLPHSSSPSHLEHGCVQI
jgi:hypothetical protein